MNKTGNVWLINPRAKLNNQVKEEHESSIGSPGPRAHSLPGLMPLVLISVSAWTAAPSFSQLTSSLFQRLPRAPEFGSSWIKSWRGLTSRNLTGPAWVSCLPFDQLTGQEGRLCKNMGSLGINCVEGAYRADRAVSVCCFHKGQTTP